MSEELAALIRAGADDEAAHAAREHPFTPDAVHRYVRDVRRRRTAHGAMAAAIGAAVVSATVLAAAHPWVATPPAEVPTGEPTSVSTPDAGPTPTPTADALPPASPAPVVTAPAPPVETTTPPDEPTTPPPDDPPPAPPGAVTITAFGPGGGSGEVYVSWDAVPGATGYRVYRSDSPDGPFVAAASFDVASGVSSDEYTGTHEYVGIWGADPSFQYVEAIGGGVAYLLVVAFNAGGEGPASGPVCGEPMASAYTCPG